MNNNNKSVVEKFVGLQIQLCRVARSNYTCRERNMEWFSASSITCGQLGEIEFPVNVPLPTHIIHAL